MRNDKKNLYILIIIITTFFITIGYAALNSTLNINGKSNISKNTWDIHFDNIVVNDESIKASVEPAISNETSVDFEINLNLPGDFYEFTVDVVNSGSIDAMIDSVIKTPDLTTEQAKYLNYIVEYENGEQITTKQLVKSNEFLRLKVRVEYKKDIFATDLPQNSETLNLGFTVNFVQLDNTGFSIKNNGISSIPTANASLDEIGTIVTIGTEQFYTIGTEGDNVKLLSMYNLNIGSTVTSLDEDTGEFNINVIENPTGKQSFNATGVKITSDSTLIFPWVGVTPFSTDEQHGTTYNDYKGSIVEEYVNDYRDLLEYNFDVNILEARLITKEELINDSIGCFETLIDEEQSVLVCINSYDFIYSTSYWIDCKNPGDDIWGIVSVGVGTSDTYDNNYSLGVRPIIVVPKNDIVVKIKKEPVALGDINEIGTIVTIGTEQFYTIGTEGNNVKLLSMYNLHVGNEITEIDISNNIIEKTLLKKPTRMQSKNVKGAIITGEFTGELKFYAPYYGTTAFSSEEIHGVNYESYEGSIVEGYVNDYKNLLEGKFDLKIEEARLISMEELVAENIGCTVRLVGTTDLEIKCTKAPSFIYSTSYWFNYSENSNYGITNLAGAFYAPYDNDYIFGVRPVIVISKDYF